MTNAVEIVKTKNDLCKGCNRCVRECPMEAVNVTYQDKDGNIKVKLDHEKCIGCGRCISACKHDARYYEDDIEIFFNDLKSGVPISLIAAPSVRTNIPEYKKLFTYLKQIGIKKIYDVSLGADICIWAHVRHFEKNGVSPLITQPCPAIVSYCKIYCHDLLKRLSPVHSPMACTSIYMKKYRGISSRIAALSPCIVKKSEFEHTGLADYSITFASILEYLRKNNISLPEEETGFDHEESGLGSLFPMPGGLKENIEYFLGKKLQITKAEGFDVYKKLNSYAQTEEDFLPDIFDVLNCLEGCNIGPACSNNKNIFVIDKIMDAGRKTHTEEQRKNFYQSTYKKFDETFDISHFSREYQPVPVTFPQITIANIGKAFELLDKDDYEKQNVDCGACGSKTCHGMARKIALGVNIPINCIVKALNSAKEEHEANSNSLEQFETIWNNVESAIMLIDAQTREIINANPSAVKLYGKEKEKIIGQHCFYFFGQHECPLLDCKQDVDRSEKRFTRHDGAVIPILKSATRTTYKGRQVFLESFNDISYIEEAENQKRLIDLGDRIQLMLSANPQINILFNSSFDVIDCNPAAYNLMGFESKEDLFTRFVEYINNCTPEFLSNGQPSVSIEEGLAAAAEKGSIKFETELHQNNGIHIYDVEMKKIPYEESFAIVVYVFDITKIREHEKELIRSRELNELQLTKMNLMIKATRIGLWDMDFIKDDPFNPENAFKWSDEIRHMLGYTDENDFPNIFKSLIDRLHPDEKAPSMAAFKKHLMDKTGKTPFDIEHRTMKKNGEYIYLRVSGETTRDEDGSPIRIAGAILDVTQSKNLIHEAEKQRAAAEAASKAKSSFLSTMSHEIRTPMNAILGIAEIQLQDETIPDGIKKSLEKIYSSGDLLLGIINDILDLSKIEAGKMELASSKYDTASLISDAAQLNIMRIGSKPIDFNLFVDENTPAFLLGDELRVKQVLNNLLSNAFKYTTAGSVGMSIFSEAAENEDEVFLILSISDTGQGMTKEQVNMLFDEYSRFNLETNRSTEGTGLGMNITQKLLRMMNGEISVESERGKGSTFTVRIPQKKIDSTPIGKEIAESLQKFRSSSRAQMKRVQISREPMPYGAVLIVDDVETNIFVARGLMASYELKIDSADSGYSAIEIIKNGGMYDIIFMDHMMPGIDGVETAKTIRGMGYNNPIVALTANAVAGQAEFFLGNGFDDYISKPIDIRRLNSILNKLIRDKQTPETIEAARRQALEKKLEAQSAAAAVNSQLAEFFIRDALKSLAVLEEISEKNNYDGAEAENLRTFIIHVHGVKTALANIGKMDLSAAALKLEKAGREKKFEIIKSEAPAFINSLRAYVKELTDRLQKETTVETEAALQQGGEGSLRDEEKQYLTKTLLDIKTACGEYDEKTADKAIAELRKKAWPAQTKDFLGVVAELMLHSEFDEIAEKIDNFINNR